MHHPQPHIEIAEASYGKDAVRVLTWSRSGGIDSVRDATLGVRVEGALQASYEHGNNSAILPSDTLRRHALAEADGLPAASTETLVERIAARILAANAAFGAVTVRADAAHWNRIHGHAFARASWTSFAEVRRSRSGSQSLAAGASGIEVLTTTGSAFTGFLRDALTTQAESQDRPLCGTIDASWTYVGDRAPAEDVAETVVARLLGALAGRPSNAVQQLLTGVGRDVLSATAQLATLTLRLRSLPVAPIPEALRTPHDSSAHEIGAGATGVTDVTLRRA